MPALAEDPTPTATPTGPYYIGTACAGTATVGPYTPTPTPNNVTTVFGNCSVTAGESLVVCLALTADAADTWNVGAAHGVACFDDDPLGSNMWFREADTSILDAKGVRLICLSALKVPDTPANPLTITCMHHHIDSRAGVVLRFGNVSRREPTDRWQLGTGQSATVGLYDHVPPRLNSSDIAIFAVATAAGPAVPFFPQPPWDPTPAASDVSSDSNVRLDVALPKLLPNSTSDPVNNAGNGNYNHTQYWAAGVMVFSK